MFDSALHSNQERSDYGFDSGIEKFAERLAGLLMGLSRRSKQFVALSLDVFCIFFTVWLAFSLRYETFYVPRGNDWLIYLIALVIALPLFSRAGLYRAVFRYGGFNALFAVAKACMQYGVLFFIVILLFAPVGVPRSVGIMQPLLLLLAIGSSRALARFLFDPGNANLSCSCIKERFLIYGAGSAGVQIANALQHNSGYSVEGFVDDDSALHGKIINGVSVYSPDEVSGLVKERGITSILIALPRATRTRRQEIYRLFEGLGVQIRTLPGIDDIADGKISISDIREVQIEDLLGREPVAPDSELFARCITGKTVLVTGAGGSIGSELCRQILAQCPLRLILVEQSEYNLYELHKELSERIQNHTLAVQLLPILGDVADKRYMLEICNQYHPHTIYHAAAYKHVPLVEGNPLEGIRNNVLGTLAVAEAAQQSGAMHMILVSTDKAVRPTNIMGASKRIAELVLQAMADEQHGSGTCFAMVRFGNVLGSSGSVVPLFKTQIRNGGPVTVTHEKVTRYFMTIPEAAQLVIQAGAMAAGGDVFLLDMGEPVKIIDLARRMIELSGLTIKDQDNPDGDIEIAVTGLRPGEKLYEELLIADNPIATKHPRIFKAHETCISLTELNGYLEALQGMIAEGECDLDKLKVLIKSMVAGYHGYQLNGKVNGCTLAEQGSKVTLS